MGMIPGAGGWSGERKRQAHRRAVGTAGHEVEIAVMGNEDAFGDGETEAGAAGSARKKGIEDAKDGNDFFEASWFAPSCQLGFGW